MTRPGPTNRPSPGGMHHPKADPERAASAEARRVLMGPALLLLAAGLLACRTEPPVAPDAVAPDFDAARARLRGPDFFPRLRVNDAQPLSTAGLAPDEFVLVAERDGDRIAFAVRDMAYHHVALTELGGEPVAITFCTVCHSGMGFVAELDGRRLGLSAGGLYAGLVLLVDDETGTYWHHITGAALRGPAVGRTLRSFPVTVLRADVAQSRYPELRVAKATLGGKGKAFSAISGPSFGAKGGFPPGFRKTLPPPDPRLDPQTSGLGVIVGDAARFYPYPNVSGRIDDELGHQRVTIVHDPDVGPPQATLSDGSTPVQLQTRWYGFSATFPETTIYGPAQRASPSAREAGLTLVHGRINVVDYDASWCAPCRELRPKIAAFARSRPDVAVHTVDVSDWTADDLQVVGGSLPVVEIYDPEGSLLDRRTGTRAIAFAEHVPRSNAAARRAQRRRRVPGAGGAEHFHVQTTTLGVDRFALAIGGGGGPIIQRHITYEFGGFGYVFVHPNPDRLFMFQAYLEPGFMFRPDKRVKFSVDVMLSGGFARVVDRDGRKHRTGFFAPRPSVNLYVQLYKPLHLHLGAGYRFVVTPRWPGPRNFALAGPVAIVGLRVLLTPQLIMELRESRRDATR